jgi:hypothetical protein
MSPKYEQICYIIWHVHICPPEVYRASCPLLPDNVQVLMISHSYAVLGVTIQNVIICMLPLARSSTSWTSRCHRHCHFRVKFNVIDATLRLSVLLLCHLLMLESNCDMDLDPAGAASYVCMGCQV